MAQFQGKYIISNLVGPEVCIICYGGKPFPMLHDLVEFDFSSYGD